MSNTTTALLVKFAMTFVAAWLTLGYMDRNPFMWILLVAILGTVLNYLLGDLVVLPKMGNVVAALGDGVMAALVAYVVAYFTRNFNTTLRTLVIFGVLVAVVEYFFHNYLLKSDTVAPREK
ncbi:DUF2512 family protein [Alkaliphilus crotonatoxidans]